MNELGKYPMTTAGCDSQIIPTGPVDRLRQRKQDLEAQLAKVNEALQALEENPNLANVLQLVGRALY